MDPKTALGQQSKDVLKCLKPYAGKSKGLFSQDQQSLYTMIAWDSSAKVVSEKIPLSETLYAIRATKEGSSLAGRFKVYQNLNDHPIPLGSVAEFSELRYDYPSLRLLPETKWIESKECVMAGTGVASYWSRYWIIAGDGIYERLAVPSSGHQKMSHGEPWRIFALEPVTKQFSDDEIAFSFSASCELIFAPEGVTESRSIILPERRKTIYFSKGATDEMILNEKKSGITLREFQILTDTQLAFGTEFWEIYGDDLERIAKGGEAESIRAWIESNSSEGWAIPDKIKIAIGRL
jgi:hypothetical protein